jgi:hypothetical protein
MGKDLEISRTKVAATHAPTMIGTSTYTLTSQFSNSACENPIVFLFFQKKTMIIALLRTPKFVNPAIQFCMSHLQRVY